ARRARGGGARRSARVRAGGGRPRGPRGRGRGPVNAHAEAGVLAVARLRRLTLLRAGRAYARWVGRAVGWWTVAYLVFWLVVFVVSGVQLAVVPAAEPLPPSVAAAASAGLSVWLAATLLRRRVPPVHLDRRDLIRLALAPVPPHAVLAYRRGLGRLGAALGGAAVGAVWSLLAVSYLHVAAPWAALGVAALAVARLDARWLLYAGPMPVPGRRLTAGRVGAGLASVAGARPPRRGRAVLGAGRHAEPRRRLPLDRRRAPRPRGVRRPRREALAGRALAAALRSPELRARAARGHALAAGAVAALGPRPRRRGRGRRAPAAPGRAPRQAGEPAAGAVAAAAVPGRAGVGRAGVAGGVEALPAPRRDVVRPGGEGDGGGRGRPAGRARRRRGGSGRRDGSRDGSPRRAGRVPGRAGHRAVRG